MPIFLGFAMTALCLILQAAAAFAAQKLFSKAHAREGGPRPGPLGGFARILVVLVLLMLGILLQMAAWAALYRTLDLFAHFEEAMYFSGVVFTSLGVGDIVIKTDARLLAPIEAANGLMMFAIVTAVLLAAIQQEASRSK